MEQIEPIYKMLDQETEPKRKKKTLGDLFETNTLIASLVALHHRSILHKVRHIIFILYFDETLPPSYF